MSLIIQLLDRIRAGQHSFYHIARGVHAAGGRERTANARRQDREPAEPQQQLPRVRQAHLADHFQVLDIDVRFEEPVEHDDSIQHPNKQQ